MKFVKAAIVLGCMYPKASCFTKAGAVGDATGDVIQEEVVQLAVINSSGGVSLTRVRQQFSSVYSI